jgi:hypothetical protein
MPNSDDKVEELNFLFLIGYRVQTVRYFGQTCEIKEVATRHIETKIHGIIRIKMCTSIEITWKKRYENIIE